MRESAVMGEVYENALINISADYAWDSTAGLSSEQRAAVAGKEIDEGIYVSHKLSPQYEHSRITHTFPFGSPFYYKFSTRNPTEERAWILQERMLSTRILHFGPCEMAWECDEHVKCECCLGPRRANLRPFRNLILSHNIHEDKIYFDGEAYPISRIWAIVLRKYTRMKLSHESDILAAISGLASRIARHTSKTYVAGIFKEDLPWSLLWVVEASSKRLKGDFPSWSWASVRGASTLDGYLHNSLNHRYDEKSELIPKYWLRVNEMNYELQESSQDRRCGVMLVLGWIVMVPMEKSRRESDFASDASKDAYDSLERFFDFRWDGELVMLHPDVSDGSEFTELDSFHLLFIASSARPGEYHDTSFHFLILRRVPTSLGGVAQQECYQRLGLVDIRRAHTHPVGLEKLMGLFDLRDIALI